MVDPVVTPLINVGVALASMLLNAAQQSQAAAIASEARDPISFLAQSLLGRRGTQKDIERRISKDLTLRMQDMNERCSREGIDPDRLANPCAEVEDILHAIDDHKRFLEQAVHDPDAVRAFFKHQAQNRRIQVDERLVPYFDELINAVTELYITYAEQSSNYQQLALKQLLKSDRESHEALARMHETIADVPHKVAELFSSASKPSRVFFGSRPEVVAGDRFIERDEQKHLITLIGDPTKRRSVLVGMSGCGKTQLASALAQQCEDSNWSLVAWVNAGSSKSIKRDLVELATELEIPTSDQPSPDTLIERCRNHLQSAKASDRLIIFDNVKDLDDLHGLVPTGDSIRIVATTTNNTGWDDQGWDTIKVGVFDREKSIDYLLTVTKSDDHDAADTLARRLGDLPLAITQAACVCKRLNISLSKFNDLLNNQPIEKVLNHTSKTEDHKDIVNTIIATYHLVFERIKDDKVAYIATCILQALCYLSESGVPTYWLTDEGVIESLDAYAILVESSLIQQSHDREVTILHPLYSYSFRKLFSRNNENLTALQTAAYCLQYGASLAWDETEPTKQVSMVKDFERQLLNCIIQDHSKGILCSKGVHEAMDALLHIQIQHREEFADLEDIARNAMKELSINWDWNDPAHYYKLE